MLSQYSSLVVGLQELGAELDGVKSNSSVTRLVGLKKFVLMKMRNGSRKDRADEETIRAEW